MKKLYTLLLLFAITTVSLSAVEFNKTSAISANSYSKTTFTANNNLYSITDIGLLKSSDNGQTWVNLDSKLTTNNVIDFAVKQNGDFLVSTNEGIKISSDEGFSWSEINNGLSGKVASKIKVTTDGNVFLGTDSGAFRWDSNANSWVKVNIAGETTGNNILAIGEDSKGNILISGSNTGISVSTDGGLSFNLLDLGINLGANLSTVTAINLDNNGKLWLGTMEGEILTLNQLTLKLEQVLDASIISDEITNIQTNTQLGTIVSTRSKGVFSSNDGINFTKVNGTGNLVHNLNVTSNGKLLVIDENGLNINSDNSTITHLDLQYDASSVLAFSSDGNNSIAVTTKGTLSGNANGYWKVGENSSNDVVFNDIMIAGNTTIAATNKGVFTLNTNTKQWVEVVSQSETGNATKIVSTSQGKILIGTDKGVLVSDDNTFSNYAVVDFTSALDIDTKVTDLKVASDGKITVSNKSLVYTSDDGGNSYKPLDLGLTINLISSIAVDGNGNIYIGTLSNGLFKSTNNGVSFAKVNGSLENVNVIDFQTQGNKLYVQTDNSILMSEDGGVSFENLTSNLNISNITSFELVGNNKIELLTDSGIFKSEDGGNTFSEVNLKVLTNLMTDIASDSQGNFILSTKENGLFKSEDGGSTWFNLGTNLEAMSLTSVEIDKSNDNKIYLGTENGLKISLDGGATFSDDTNSELKGGTIIGLDFTKDNRLIVKYGNDSKIAILNQSGVSSTIKVNGEDSGLITTNAMGDILTVSSEAGLFVSIDGGLNYQKVENDGGTTTLKGVVSLSSNSNSLVLATNNKILLKTNDKTTDITGNLGLSNISKVNISDNGSLIVMGNSKIKLSTSSDFSSFIDVTGDIGNSQNTILNFDIMNNGNLLIATKNALYVGSATKTGREKVKVDLTDVNFSRLTVFNNSTILASTDGGLMVSENFGRNYYKLLLEGRVVLDAAVNSTGEIFASTKDNGFLKLNMNGEILANLSSQFNGEVVENVESDGNSIIIANSKTIIKISNDGGMTWAKINGSISSISKIIQDAHGKIVVITDEGTAFMLDTKTTMMNQLMVTATDINGFGTDLAGNLYLSSKTMGVFRSENNGESFTSFNTGLTSNAVLKLTSSEEGNVYALTSDGIFQFDTQTNAWYKVVNDTEGNFSSATDLKAINGPVKTIFSNISNNNDVLVMSTSKGAYYTEPLSPASVSELANRVINIYPNPANSLNNLTLTMEQSSEADLNVYNSNGQIIAKLDNLYLKQGENKINLQLNNLTVGNYFVELKVGNLTLTKQMVIIK